MLLLLRQRRRYNNINGFDIANVHVGWFLMARSACLVLGTEYGTISSGKLDGITVRTFNSQFKGK